MSAINGTTVLIYKGGTAIAMQKNCTLNIENDTPDATHKGSGGYANYIQGLRKLSVDVEGITDLTDTTGNISILASMIENRETATVEVRTTHNGDWFVSFVGILSNLTLDNPMEDVASWSGTILCDGTPTFGTISNSNS